MAAAARRGRPPKACRTVQESIVPCSDLVRKYPSVNTLQSAGPAGFAFPPPKVCCICIDDDFPVSNPRAFLTSCSHEYHYECILTACEKNESKCPSCRKDIVSVAVLRVVCSGPQLDAVTLGVREKRVRKKVQISHLTAEENAELYGVATEAELSANCTVCHSGEREGELLLCDGRCGTSTHYDCAGLKGIPAGEWFCAGCCGGDTGASEDRAPEPSATVAPPRRPGAELARRRPRGGARSRGRDAGSDRGSGGAAAPAAASSSVLAPTLPRDNPPLRSRSQTSTGDEAAIETTLSAVVPRFVRRTRPRKVSVPLVDDAAVELAAAPEPGRTGVAAPASVAESTSAATSAPLAAAMLDPCDGRESLFGMPPASSTADELRKSDCAAEQPEFIAVAPPSLPASPLAAHVADHSSPMAPPESLVGAPASADVALPAPALQQPELKVAQPKDEASSREESRAFVPGVMDLSDDEDDDEGDQQCRSSSGAESATFDYLPQCPGPDVDNQRSLKAAQPAIHPAGESARGAHAMLQLEDESFDFGHDASGALFATLEGIKDLSLADVLARWMAAHLRHPFMKSSVAVHREVADVLGNYEGLHVSLQTIENVHESMRRNVLLCDFSRALAWPPQNTSSVGLPFADILAEAECRLQGKASRSFMVTLRAAIEVSCLAPPQWFSDRRDAFLLSSWALLAYGASHEAALSSGVALFDSSWLVHRAHAPASPRSRRLLAGSTEGSGRAEPPVVQRYLPHGLDSRLPPRFVSALRNSFLCRGVASASPPRASSAALEILDSASSAPQAQSPLETFSDLIDAAAKPGGAGVGAPALEIVDLLSSDDDDNSGNEDSSDSYGDYDGSHRLSPGVAGFPFLSREWALVPAASARSRHAMTGHHASRGAESEPCVELLDDDDDVVVVEQVGAPARGATDGRTSAVLELERYLASTTGIPVKFMADAFESAVVRVPGAPSAAVSESPSASADVAGRSPGQKRAREAIVLDDSDDAEA